MTAGRVPAACPGCRGSTALSRRVAGMDTACSGRDTVSDAPRAKKSLGQHFLKDARIARRIVDLLIIDPGDRVLEIGPGPGALTAHIMAAAPSRLLLVEKDDYWAAYHADARLTGAADCAGRLEVRTGDALDFPWESLSGPWKIISNLPYNVGSPLVWDIVSRVPELTRAVFMVQKEVAERLCASPGGREYGALSVWVQSHARVEWGFEVGPGAFAPPPKVDSAVVALTPLPPAARPEAPEALAGLLRRCFQHRRKQLQSLLRKTGTRDATAALDALGISPEARPETLSPELFQKLALALRRLC